MSELRRQFARRLKELRQQKGMTQEELAQATGLSISFIRSIEQAIYAPSFESLEIISRAFNVDVKEMFEFNL
ncbi:MAG: helix-turn-helix transcriptional regulator [Anaerolineae bacterium]|nr:helix-turn-helix transcriptional regulator [Anaerolineae bacterium]